ncbi:MAG: hypothetical protein JWP76_1216 [Dactylosporangium sp.]|nr:hypothetical protein [Dactylosporangium sp.]
MSGSGSTQVTGAPADTHSAVALPVPAPTSTTGSRPPAYPKIRSAISAG